MATPKRGGLGRGISALLPTAQERGARSGNVFFDNAAPPAYLTRPSGRASGEESESTLADQAATAEAAEAAVAEIKPAPRSGSRAGRKPAKPAPSTSDASTPSDQKIDGERSARPASRFDLRMPGARTLTGVDELIRDTTAAATARSTGDAPVEPGIGAAASVDAAAAGASAADAAADAPEPPAGLVPVPGAVLRHLNPADIVPNAKQPRLEFDEDALDELILSVREFGVLQPIVVRPLPEGDERSAQGAYELIMGERRLRASKAAGLDRIPAVIRDTADDAMLRDALLENLHRSQLNPLEEASAYQQLLDDFGITQEQLAERIGRSRPQISNTLRLLKLPVDVQTRVAAGVLSAGHARAILSAREPEAMLQLAEKIVNEDLSVRAAEAAAAKTASRPERKTTIRTSTSGGLSGRLVEVGEKLGDKLDTRVKVTLGRSKGQIVIDFASMTDLNRILEELGGIDEE